MTYPRAHLVDAENGGLYHVFTRCVQQQWLCGTDPETGHCFDHRKQWIEDRLIQLASIFAIDLYAYAVMSNHYHAVLETVVERARGWSDEEVARRWLRLRPKLAPEDVEPLVEMMLTDPERIAELRRRLGNLSWFMSYLNEYIARRANRESGAKGHFWQSRFESKRLLDDGAVLGCMAYVDLNPVRAHIAECAEDAPHTSFRRRVFDPDSHDSPLVPLSAVGLTLEHYRALLEWTASVTRGSVEPPEHGTANALGLIGYEPDAWLSRVQAHRFKYRAYGALRLLRSYVDSLGQRWMRGAKPGLAAPG